MSDDSEPGEIKSPDISAVIRHKRTAEDKRSYKSEKKLRLEKEHKNLRDDYKEYKKDDYRHEDRSSYERDRRDYEERTRDYERDRLEREHLERDRVERDRVERDRVDRDRAERDPVEKDRIERDRGERDRLDRDRLERDRLERDRLEREYIERDRVEKERIDKKDVDYYKKDDIGGKRSGFKDDYKPQSYKKEDVKEDKRKDCNKEKFKIKEDKKLRSDEERVERTKLSREEELLDEIRSISEEINKTKSKREGKSPSSSSERREKKERVKDPEKKKKKEAKKNKEKHAVTTQDKYEKILKDKLKEPSPQSPEEVSIRGGVAAPPPLPPPVPPTLASKKKSLLDDSSSSSDNEFSDEEMTEPRDVSPDPVRPTPSPSPPPDPLAGLPPYYPALQGCRNVDHFEYLNRIEEGTYGVVFRARDKRTNEHVALKKLKMEKEKQGFPITSLREINTLLKGQHENVVHVREIVVGSNMDKIYIVMDYVEHDLKALMENMKEPFLIGEVKTIMRQLMNGLAFLHDNWIIHRDIKTSNLLFSHGGILKIGDFGLAREYGSPLKQYTEVVVTLWYRAPELLLGCKMYSVPIDVWSAGCVFGELLGQKALFPGKSEIDQLNKIFKELGTPNEKIWPGYSDLPATQRVSFVNHPYNKIGNRFPQSILSQEGFALLNKLLCYDPAKRITAAEAVDHKWFSEGPLPVDPSMFPTWPAKSEMNANPKNKIKSPTPPSGGGAADKLENSGFKFLTTMQGSSSKGPGFILK